MRETTKGRLITLIEHKLVGSQRQEALKWARSRGVSIEKMEGLIKRLEPLPDTGAPNSRTVYGDQARDLVRAAYMAGTPVPEIRAKYHVPAGTIYRFVADLPKRRKRRS